ncbi:transcription factor Tfb4-domain-containing protein [Dunaliella salina]|uniref:General transcription and DNA repair factor IIH subunit TFB4 n=1 Tax=Dunaliella salina TaxID=3046 RepID=A0ABQ7FUZ2_DUNSA|nr:transcription factor Tfb4-domain-containing protein [Dunaliella salina]|eukprot:KAF5826210.1 transcription factor Tfb4-domain-containing protein [Dunaliella salina]
MINDRNHLAVFAVRDLSCEILHMSLGDATPKSPELSNPTRNIGNKLVAIIQAMAQQDAINSPRAPLALSGALSRALCLVHRLRSKPSSDAMVLGPPGFDSSFLQQAAHLTGGLYLRAPIGGIKPEAQGAGSTMPQQGHGHMGAALQYLLSCLSADTVTRSMLRVHQPLGVDFRASCFCHKRPLNVGFVCSVCLSIFCTQLPHCAICGTAFTR